MALSAETTTRQNIVANDDNMPTIGTAIASDPTTDPKGLFSATTGVNVSASDYVPMARFRMIEIRGGAGGQTGVTVIVKYINGSITTHTVTVAANDIAILEGWFTGIGVGSTASLIYPFF